MGGPDPGPDRRITLGGTHMKISIVAIIAIALVAGTAGAEPDGILSSTSKIPVVKQSGQPDKGLLDCSGAVEIALDNVYYGDNTGLPNNVSTYGCSTWDESAGEYVFHLYLAEPAMFEAYITPDGCDLDLAVLDQCDEDLGCLIVVDEGVITNVPVSGDFYFVVDGYAGAECSFTFEIISQALPEPVDFCASVLDVYGTHFEGDTCDGENNIATLDCGDYTEAGLEHYYEVLMPAGSSFTADVTYAAADGALWVLDGCAEPFGCLAYADNTLDGQTETITYTNDTGSDTFVYLVLDSWGTGACGAYVMDFQSTGGAIPAESRSFSDVKAMFR